MKQKNAVKEEIVENTATEDVSKKDKKKAKKDKKQAKPVKDDILKELEEKVNMLTGERDNERDRLLRATAEFENFKKRSARETSDFRRYANESLIKELLPVVDNLERALDSSTNLDETNGTLAEGVEMVMAGTLKALEKFSVKQVVAVGEVFDPSFHQAVMQEESDDEKEGTILKELQKGYLLHDRLIRPSMVVVAKKKSS